MQFNNTCLDVAPVMLWVVLVSVLTQGACFAGPFAYVPGRYAWGGPMINKIDLKNGFKTTQITLNAFPQTIYLHPDGSVAYLRAFNMNDDISDRIINISILDTKTGTYLHRFENAGLPIGMNNSTRELYVSTTKSVVVVLDLATYTTKKEYQVKGTPFFVFDSKRQPVGQLKILYQYGSIDKPMYGIYDTETNSDVEIPISSSVEPAIERQRKKLFLFAVGTGKVYVLDVDTPTLVSVVDVGGVPLGGIAASTNSDEVFVVTSASKSSPKTDVVVLDSMTGAIIRRMRIPGDSTFTHMNTSEYFPDDLYIATQENFFVVDKVTGAVKFTLPNLLGNNWGGLSPALGTYVLDAPKDQIDSDRLFNWAEDKYPTIFPSPPQRPFSDTAEGYYFRHYPGTDNYLGTKGGNVYFLPAGMSMDGILNLGTMDKFLPDADKDGY